MGRLERERRAWADEGARERERWQEQAAVERERWREQAVAEREALERRLTQAMSERAQVARELCALQERCAHAERTHASQEGLLLLTKAKALEHAATAKVCSRAQHSASPAEAAASSGAHWTSFGQQGHFSLALDEMIRAAHGSINSNRGKPRAP